MSELAQKFCNALLCEDIRDEVGGKHSLMGVIGGDVTLPFFPVTIQLAAYLQYYVDEAPHQGEIDAEVSIFQDDFKIVGGNLKIQRMPNEPVATIVLPKGLVTFSKPTTYRIVFTVGGMEAEVISKKVMLAGEPSSASVSLPPS